MRADVRGMWGLAGLLIAAAAPAMAADGPTGPLVEALSEELSRDAEGLSLPEAPRIYHLTYHLALRDSADAVASYGALLQSEASPANNLGIEIRLGSPQFDNTGFVGGHNGFTLTGIPDVATPAAVRLAAWRATDGAYKAAVAHYATKVAEYTQPPDHPGDFQLTGPTVAAITGHAPVSAEKVEGLAIRLSAAVPEDAGLERAEVRVYHQSGLLYTVDTAGTRVVRPTEEAGVRAVAFARGSDGALLSDHRSWLTRSPEGFPSEAEMAAAIEEMALGLKALAAAPTLDGEYVGPVIFEDQAAVDLFRYLLVDQLEGTPGDASSTGGRGIFGSFGSGGGDVRLSRRVLPPGWTVVDDPRQDASNVASFQYDDEGTATQRVELVEDGIVQSLLMSRVPRKGLDGTNGHARSAYDDRALGRAMMMTVTPERHQSRRRLYRQGLRLARAYGRDYVVVVRRLEDPPVRGYADFASRVSLMIGADGSATLPMSLVAVRRYKDGREEPIRGAAFANVQRFALRDIAAAGPQRELTYLADLSPGDRSSNLTAGFPTWLSAPEVLVGELELVPTSGDPKDIGVIPPPR